MGSSKRAVSDKFLFISYFARCNVFLSLADPLPRLDLTKAEYALIKHFCMLSDEQRSYKSVLTPVRFHRHGFYPSLPGKVVEILDSIFFSLFAF